MSDQAPPKSIREVVLDALREIYSRTRGPVTRSDLMDFTGLPAASVEWQLRAMTAAREDVVRCGSSGYKPIHRHPEDRAMSLTPLDYGTLKIEIGDTILTLTPGELRKLAPGLAGYAGLQG